MYAARSQGSGYSWRWLVTERETWWGFCLVFDLDDGYTCTQFLKTYQSIPYDRCTFLYEHYTSVRSLTKQKQMGK